MYILSMRTEQYSKGKIREMKARKCDVLCVPYIVSHIASVSYRVFICGMDEKSGVCGSDSQFRLLAHEICIINE